MSTDQTNQTSESGSTDCSIVINAGEIPKEAVNFANAVAELAEANGIQDFQLDCRVYTGVYSEIWKNEDRRGKKLPIKLKGEFLCKRRKAATMPKVVV